MALLNDFEYPVAPGLKPDEWIWTSGSGYSSTNANDTIATISPSPNRKLLILGQSNSGGSEIVEFRFGGASNGITFKGDTQPAIIFTYPFVFLGEIIITRPYNGSGRHFWQQAESQ